jgi:hypothetical protein
VTENTTAPTAVSSIVFGQPTPAAGSNILIAGAPPGAFIPRGSDRLSIPIIVTSGPEVPWAQLNVYLLTGEAGLGYCGQNLPDAPTLGAVPKRRDRNRDDLRVHRCIGCPVR